jgi:hypothetical protein
MTGYNAYSGRIFFGFVDYEACSEELVTRYSGRESYATEDIAFVLSLCSRTLDISPYYPTLKPSSKIYYKVQEAAESASAAAKDLWQPGPKVRRRRFYDTIHVEAILTVLMEKAINPKDHVARKSAEIGLTREVIYRAEEIMLSDPTTPTVISEP